MNKMNGRVDRIKTWLVIVLLTSLTGCAGFWGGGSYYNDGYYYDNGEGYLFGGGYDNGRDAHNYSQRGSASRAAAHSGGSHVAAHSGSGGGKSARR